MESGPLSSRVRGGGNARPAPPKWRYCSKLRSKFRGVHARPSGSHVDFRTQNSCGSESPKLGRQLRKRPIYIYYRIRSTYVYSNWYTRIRRPVWLVSMSKVVKRHGFPFDTKTRATLLKRFPRFNLCSRSVEDYSIYCTVNCVRFWGKSQTKELDWKEDNDGRP